MHKLAIISIMKESLPRTLYQLMPLKLERLSIFLGCEENVIVISSTQTWKIKTCITYHNKHFIEF